jgi:hypothetical protein
MLQVVNYEKILILCLVKHGSVPENMCLYMCQIVLNCFLKAFHKHAPYFRRSEFIIKCEICTVFSV